MYDLNHKICIITGSGRGIGSSVAESLSKKGASVLINVRKHIDEGESTVLEINKKGKAALSVADVSTEEGVKKLFDDCIENFGIPDVLINNAGVGILEPFASLTEKSMDIMLRTNLYSAIYASKKFASISHGGVIINIASLAGIIPFPGLSVYGITKAGLISLTKSLAVELAASGIRANAVAPGIVKTRMGDSLLQIMNINEDDYGKKYTLTGKLIDVNEVAETVVYLIENESMTGEVIEIDSGVKQMLAGFFKN